MLNKEKTITILLDEYNRLLESQKQVDKLKEENEELYKEHTTCIAGSILQKKKAVKDTAKEILQRVKCFGERDEGLRIALLDIADDYDVWVDE